MPKMTICKTKKAKKKRRTAAQFAVPDSANRFVHTCGMW